MTILVPYASHNLTDHLSCGEGLLSFSWLKTLTDRGHRVLVFSSKVNLEHNYPNLHTWNANTKSRSDIVQIWKQSIASWRFGRNQLRKEKIDVVWRLYPYNYIAPLIPGIQLPLVLGPLYSVYSIEKIQAREPFKLNPYGIHRLISGPLWRRSLRAADLIFTESKPLVPKVETCAPQALVRHLPGIAEPPSELANVEREFSHEMLRLAFVGNFNPPKRVLDMVEVLHLLANKGIPFHADLVGDGPDRAAAEAKVQNLNLQDNVTFHGALPHHAVFSVMAKCHYLVHLLSEAYGRVFVEAMSVGTPIIAPNRNAVRDFVENGRNGMLLDDLSVENYATTIAALWAQNDKLPSMSQAAKSVAAGWTERAIGDYLEKSLEEAVIHHNKTKSRQNAR